MEYVYAALLLHKLKQGITEDNIKNIIKATGIVPDDIKVKSLVVALNEVNIDDALKSAASISAAPVSTSAGNPPAAATQKTEEKVEEKKEEEALEGLSSLFG